MDSQAAREKTAIRDPESGRMVPVSAPAVPLCSSMPKDIPVIDFSKLCRTSVMAKIPCHGIPPHEPGVRAFPAANG